MAESVTWILQWMKFLSILFYSSVMIGRNELDGAGFDVLFLILNNDLDVIGIWGAMGGLLGLAALFVVLGCIGLNVTTSGARVKSRPRQPLAEPVQVLVV